jgi:quinol monooxygenase YgiN
MDMDPSHSERLIREAQPLIEASLEEPGCKAYTWSHDPFVPGRVNVYEQWMSEEALAEHFTLPAYLDMRVHLRSAGAIKSISRKFRVDHDEPVYDESGTPRADFFTI